MRYLNWDVLVFPEGTKTPVQEFKTGCYVVQDTDFPQLRSPLANFTVPGQLPAVTCFIPSLPAGFAFRVSIHSWEPPSHSLEGIVNPHDILIFEARVFVDGVFASSMLFSDKGPWPQVLDWTAGLDKNGNLKSLAFPVFHSEILTQSWWSASQDLGRVKVVISEGYARGQPEMPFQRVKNVVVFSFQHAPQEILEASGTAWPNSGIWQQIYLPLIARSRSSLNAQNNEREVHTRSSVHLDATGNGFKNMVSPQTSFGATSGRNFASLAALSNHSLPVSQTGPWMTPDSFMENSLVARWNMENRAISDSSFTASSATSRRTTGSLAQSVNQDTSLSEAARNLVVEQILDDNSSRSESPSGIVATTNNRRASSTLMTSMHPPPSAAAEARAASYTGYANRKLSTARPPSAMRTESNISDMSLRSRFSEEQNGSEQKENTDPVIRATPAKVIRGKKEGKDMNAVETPPQANNSGPTDAIKLASNRNEPTVRPNLANAMVPKRKRSLASLMGKMTGRSDPTANVDALDASPTRKFSRGTTQTSSSQSIEVTDLPSKDTSVPLGSIENTPQG